MAGVKVKV